jgi:hypothetical protein
MKSELRLTDTNAASDSKGLTWGLEGNLVWWLIGGIGAGIVSFFLLIVIFRAGLLSSCGFAVVPVLLCLAYIFGLRHGKPPGYDRDCFENWTSGTGFRPEIRNTSSTEHPLSQIVL